ncbi:MAG: MlaA family lipoprotein, partial [Pseudomonadota bacterium]
MITVSMPRRVAALGLALLLTACASSDQVATDPADPYEATNRTFHEFNVTLDENVLRPVAQGYDVVAVGPLKLMIGNGLNHLRLPVHFVNYALQGDARMVGRTLSRFTLNTIVGAAGLL